jgi:hypothetical protein
MVKGTNLVIFILIIVFSIRCSSEQIIYEGKEFNTEEELNQYKIALKDEEKKAEEAKEQKILQIAESALSYFTEKVGKEKILDLRLEENKQSIAKAYFDEHGNKTVNKYSFDNQFEYNRIKPELDQIKKKKYLFYKAETMRLSAYDFKTKNYNIEYAKVTLPLPKHTLHFKVINLTGTRTVNESINIGGYYRIINELAFPINLDKAEAFLERWKTNKTTNYILMEIVKIKDENEGIRCSALRDTLFEDNDDENIINMYIKPTCISEKWDKLMTRHLETKIVGYYIVDDDLIYKNITK